MSRFSGKCDLCDEIEIFGLERILNSDVYVGDTGTSDFTTTIERHYRRK